MVPAEIPNYTLLTLLGEGAMAQVWLAEHQRNERKAAIKILKPAADDDGNFEKLFLREGQVLAGFDHPNIVKIYDNNRVGDVSYLVMEHLAGGTLLERMRSGPITIGEAIGLIAQVASGLDAAHRQQVIHRDLKPANIMLRDETTPVLTDFGAVRVLDRSTIYGKEGLIVGTPIYMSPEQISGQTLSGSSDLYALGVIFYELLTGDRPFPGMSVAEIASNHLYAPIPTLPPSIAMLQPVIDRLLAKKPADRYPSAQAFIDDLRALFIHDEALRLQVGYSGTSMAWSSQLRALGFVLDAEQKNVVRRAQGDYLHTQAAGTQGADTRPRVPVAPTNAAARNGEAREQPRTALDGSKRRRGAWTLVAGILLAAALGGGGWWWQQRERLTPLPEPSTQTTPDPVAAQASAPAAVAPAPPAVAPAPAAVAPAPGATSTAAEDEAAALAAAIAGINELEMRIRYTAHPDGTVHDNTTGLIWADSDNGADIDWSDARRYCAGLGGDWELPSQAELKDLYDHSGSVTQRCGSMECKVIPLIQLTSAYHWSSHARDELSAWLVDLSDGEQLTYAVVNPFEIRALCVRHS